MNPARQPPFGGPRSRPRQGSRGAGFAGPLGVPLEGDGTSTRSEEVQTGWFHFSGETAVGRAMVDVIWVLRWAGPPLGGQMPWATASARARLRASIVG